MKDISQTEEFRVNFIESLVAPCIPSAGKQKRARSAPTKIKSLYHLFQLNKNIKNKKWSKNFQGKTAISEKALVSKRHFSDFVNSSDFNFLGKVKHRGGTTNEYELEPWVVDMFSFFEKKGMMQNFRQDFDKWKRTFLKRINHWLLPLLRKGHTLSQILMNRLSTKQNLKGVDPKHLKGVGIKPKASPSRVPYEALQGSRTKQSVPSIPAFQEFCELSETLSTRFLIKDGDLNMLMNSYSLKQIKGGIRMRESYRLQGFMARSPIASFIHCIEKSKKHSV
jgi:hypothetical protein